MSCQWLNHAGIPAHSIAAVFRRTVDWAIAHGITTATFHIQTPYPGTRLFARMEAAGRLLTRDWDRYDTRQVVFRPARLSAEGRQVLEGAAVIGGRVEAWLLDAVAPSTNGGVEACLAAGVLRVEGDAFTFCKDRMKIIPSETAGVAIKASPT